jgi:hypothetical protein
MDHGIPTVAAGLLQQTEVIIMATTQRRITFGKGGTTKMFGRGDHTKVATADSAGEQAPAITSQKARNKRQFAEGGTMPRSGGLAAPAKSGETGPPGATAGQSTRNYSKGGEARPARPGRCAP